MQSSETGALKPLRKNGKAQYRQTQHRRLLGRKVIDCHRIFEQRIIAGDHSDAAFGYEITLSVGLRVIANGCSFGDMHVAVENRAPDLTTTSHVGVREKNAGLDLAVGVHPDIRRQDAALNDSS